MKKREPYYTTVENRNRCSHCGKQYGDSLRTKNKATIWSSNSTSGYTSGKNKTLIWKDTRTPMFVAALFIIAKTRKQPKYPSTGDWLKNMWYMYIVDYYSTIKQNETFPCAAVRMVLENIILSETNQTRERQILYDITYRWNPKNYTNESIYKTNWFTDTEQGGQIRRDEQKYIK